MVGFSIVLGAGSGRLGRTLDGTLFKNVLDEQGKKEEKILTVFEISG